jgi:signal transduction histidine kinase
VGADRPELPDLPGAVADTVRLRAPTADPLLPTRLDAGKRPRNTPVDLGALVHEEVSQRTGDRIPVAMSVLESGPVEVTGSRGQLARVIGNLPDNAERHAESSVAVSVFRDRGSVVVAVTDDGAGVAEPERERIFERFVRLGDARSRGEGGAGPGLAIARDVAHRHGGTLTATRAAEGGARSALRLPGTESSPSGD